MATCDQPTVNTRLQCAAPSHFSSTHRRRLADNSPSFYFSTSPALSFLPASGSVPQKRRAEKKHSSSAEKGKQRSSRYVQNYFDYSKEYGVEAGNFFFWVR